MAANVYATASEDDSTAESGANRNDQVLASGAATIDCPDVGGQLTAVPDQVKTEVDRELALLDKQITEAYQRLQSSAQAVRQDSGFADSSIMNPLKEKRAATIDRIVIAIDRVGDAPQGLDAFAPCTLRASGNQTEQGGQGDGQDAGQGGDGQEGQNQNQGDGQDQNQGGQQGGNGGQAGNGPVAADFVDITTVRPNVQSPNKKGDASRGTFTTSCGVNANGLFNSDNVIVAPGVTNGAHHFHDYVGNQSNDAFASDEDLANADTTCENEGDKSSYFWPVLRLQNGTEEQDAASPGGGIEGNVGEIVTPRQVTMAFVGNPRSEVTAMPKLLRIITGDAKAFVNGTANANASWSCTGFENKVQLKDKYPLCPSGSDVVRTFKFQSCWDGKNIDSANHRTHVAFAAADGSCASGFKAIPQLVQRIVYDVDAPSLEDGGRTTPLFAVDSFPEQVHKPVTDHGDFINVFDEELMREMVDCINDGRQCDAAAPGGEEPEPGNTPKPTPTPTASPDAPSGGNGQDDEPADNGGKGEEPADTGGQESPEPSTSTQVTEPAGGPDGGGDNAAPAPEPKIETSPSAGGSVGDSTDGTDNGDYGDSGDYASAVPGPEPTTGSGSQPQASTGGLADTGTQLWPAAAGAVLLISGFVLLRRFGNRAG
ncbi:DUF1996 domain-containing protein [Streptomyces sp. NPDC050704]|uniref:DUF1996 domain-containing protein n=1 Tax=Streptomyces sp. NPDC050704 TaxID=3157219 RepID=UPI0034252EEF